MRGSSERPAADGASLGGRGRLWTRLSFGARGYPRCVAVDRRFLVLTSTYAPPFSALDASALLIPLVLLIPHFPTRDPTVFCAGRAQGARHDFAVACKSLFLSLCETLRRPLIFFVSGILEIGENERSGDDGGLDAPESPPSPYTLEPYPDTGATWGRISFTKCEYQSAGGTSRSEQPLSHHSAAAVGITTGQSGESEAARCIQTPTTFSTHRRRVLTMEWSVPFKRPRCLGLFECARPPGTC